jgi:hypothetical protein
MPTKKKKKKSPAKAKKVLKEKAAQKKKAPPKKAAPKKRPAPKKARARGGRQHLEAPPFETADLGARSGGQSGNLQGLSDTAQADSESVDELLEEGNTFEAEVVEGVEDAPEADVSEVRTHEFPEDDVPEEYLDQD